MAPSHDLARKTSSGFAGIAFGGRDVRMRNGESSLRRPGVDAISRSGLKMFSSSPVPTTASTSGMFFRISLRKRSTRQPATTKLLRAAFGFVLRHLQDGVYRFLLGRVDERAGVYHDDVGIFGAGREFGTGVSEHTHHDLAVDEVLGATEADKADFRTFGQSVSLALLVLRFGCGLRQYGKR